MSNFKNHSGREFLNAQARIKIREDLILRAMAAKASINLNLMRLAPDEDYRRELARIANVLRETIDDLTTYNIKEKNNL
jgi:hypothetical protein